MMQPAPSYSTFINTLQANGILAGIQAAFRKFPAMPENPLGLSNGDVLRSITDELGSFAPRGKEFPIFFDGSSVRCSPPGADGSISGPAWSVAQLCNEISENGWWQVSGNIFSAS